MIVIGFVVMVAALAMSIVYTAIGFIALRETSKEDDEE